MKSRLRLFRRNRHESPRPTGEGQAPQPFPEGGGGVARANMTERSKRIAVLCIALGLPLLFVGAWAHAAQKRLDESVGAAHDVAVASVSDDSYCTPALKTIIRRVAGACGLIQGAATRGCQPTQARKVAAMSDREFNALFTPLSRRAHIIQFDAMKSDLDDGARAELEKAWSDQRGA